MPLAVPLRRALGPDPAPRLVVEAVAEVTHTLAELVEHGISHRDLKPDNLLRLDDVWSIGDFGLVKQPEGEPLTRHGRKLGPTDYMAPEMRESPDTADPEFADVYSIAKTLWVLLAGINLPFPGQHRADDDICRLTQRIDSELAPYLDLLIERCTTNEPQKRPRMHEVAHELQAMLAPSTQEAAVSDTGELERRIAAMTEQQRRQDQSRSGFHNAIAIAWQRLADDVAKRNYEELANRLPNFSTRHPVQVAAPRELILSPSVYPGEGSWGGSIIAPGTAGVRADLGLIMRVHDDAGRCSFAAIIQVNRHNQARGLTIDILQRTIHTTIGSAHFDATAAAIDAAFAGSIPSTLTEVANGLEAERRLAAERNRVNDAPPPS